jgi:Tic22-like family
MTFRFLRDTAEATSTTTADGPVEKFAAMTQQEIEDWMEHIPVFAVTDPNGAGIVLRPDNDTSVFYFFFNPMQANATLQQLKASNEQMDLKISAFSLGKIWFTLLNADSEGEKTKGVEYRLVPDTRDLLGARMLLTLSPEDGDKLKAAGSMTPELAQEAIKKAMTESPKFNTTFNEIPVFTIAQMRMQKQLEEGEEGEPLTLLPMYFSLQNMVGTWQQFIAQGPADVKEVEPAINLMSLHDLIAMMQKESEIDWRNVILVPGTPSGSNSSAASSATTSVASSADPMAQMGGATLGDE